MSKQIKSDKERTRTRVAVYLVGLHGDTILLGKRKNTVHMNGFWSLVAGHVHEGESCMSALVREVQEECGITLHEKDIALIGAMHHDSPPYEYANYVYRVDLQNYEPINQEPEKCEMLAFFPYKDLPEPMADYIKFIIEKTVASNHPWIAEYGWE